MWRDSVFVYSQQSGFCMLIAQWGELRLHNYARLPIIAQCGLYMLQVHVLESFLEGRGVFIVFLEFSKTKNYGIPLMLFNYGIP